MTTLRKIPTDAEKIRAISTLYMIVFNSEDNLTPLSLELFHLLGEILEGKTPQELSMYRIDKKTFLKELSVNT